MSVWKSLWEANRKAEDSHKLFIPNFNKFLGIAYQNKLFLSYSNKFYGQIYGISPHIIGVY